VAIGKGPTYVMQQLGHTDPAFTLRVYAHMMRRSEGERGRLKALVEGRLGSEWAVCPQFRPAARIPQRLPTTRKPRLAGLSGNRGARI
jgi:hypothetical protein